MSIFGGDRLPISKITVKEPTKGAERMFKQIIAGTVQFHDDERVYLSLCENIAGEKMPLGFSEAEPVKTRHGHQLKEPVIHINREDFGRAEGVGYEKYVVAHEKSELWMMASGVWAEEGTPESDKCDDISHRRSLIVEFDEAVRDGVGGKYFGFIKRSAKLIPKVYRDRYLRENKTVFKAIQKKKARK